MNQEEIKKVTARILYSTERKKREFSLYNVALDIKNLKEELGSMNKVSEIIGISSGTLNKFLSVLKLPQPILELVKKKQIDSLEIAYNLNKLNSRDILDLGNFLKDNDILSHDLRHLIAYRKQNKSEPILELLHKVLSSKNIRISVIKFFRTDLEIPLDAFTERLKTVIGEDNIVSIEEDGNFIKLKISKEGERKIRAVANDQHTTFKKLFQSFLK